MGAYRLQLAFPAQSEKLESVFVDSGAFPEGIYSKRHMFTSVRESVVTRVCGLLSSASSNGRGDVSMWLPPGQSYSTFYTVFIDELTSTFRS